MSMHSPQFRTRDDAIEPTLESLLDEALAAPSPADDLNDRIVAATLPQLRAEARDDRAVVVGRIGFASVWRVAAAVAVAGMLGWITLTMTTPTTSGPASSASGQVVLSEQEERELLAAFVSMEGNDFDLFEADQLAWQTSIGDAEQVDGADAAWAVTRDPVDALLDTFEDEWLVF